MKTNYSHFLKALLVLFSFLLITNASNAQNQVEFTVVQAPCNNDGILVADASNTTVTPPITFSYYLGGQQVVHTVNTITDTLFNYSGGTVYVNIMGTGGQSYGYFGGQPPFTYVTTTTPAICPALGNALVAISGGTSPYTVEWLETGTGIIVATGESVSLPAGQYSVLITDAAGCVFGSYAQGDSSVFIYNSSSITFDLTTTAANCTDGSATITNEAGGIAPYSYQWSNGANTSSISGLILGQYMVTVTDAQGCYQSQYTYIQQSISISANPTATPATCLEDDGSAIAFGGGGTPPYSYSWSNGQQTQTATNLTSGYYLVTVTDANSCIGIGYANVTATTPITATYSSTPSSCTSATGTATVNISGGTAPYTTTWNTFPPQSGTTATGLAAGNYGFHITDAVGCIRTGSVVVNPISIITGNVNTTNAMCLQTNGAASILVTSGAPPYTYSWSTGATSTSINNLAAGGYSVTITDDLSCQLVKYASVQTSSPISIGLNVTPASCIFASDGSITATPVGGTAPYTYSWSNGQTTSTASGLASGYYSVFISDAVGCTKYDWTNLSYNASNNSCYCTITGKVYEDLNSNCIYDSGEPGMQNIMMHCSGIGYAFSDANGDYSFIVPSGTYTLSESVQYYYPLAACQSNAVTVTVVAASGCVSNVDFANVINPIHDMQIVTTSYNQPVPGNTYTQKVIIKNAGSITESNVQAGYTHDGQMPLSGIAPGIFTQQNAGSYPNWHSITSGFSLTPAAFQLFNIDYAVPTNIPLGTSLVYFDTTSYDAIANWLVDYTPWTNVNQYYSTVVGSFDPNFKEVTPQGVGIPGNIQSKDSILTYTVHFQNTGTYPAQKVVVIDTLDADLNIGTMQPIYASHDCVTKVDEDGVITFTFDNINLPDSNSNPLASQGMVTYSIHMKPNLAEGAQITNNASIYFDYNEPVVTNTTLNTIDNISSVKNINSVFDFMLYPNPGSDKVSILVNTDASGNTSVNVYNILGQSLQSKTVSMKQGKNAIDINVSALPEGMYLVELKQGQRSEIKKLNVLK